MNSLFDFSQKKTNFQAFVLYLIFGLVPTAALAILGSFLGLSGAATYGLLLLVAIVLPSALTIIVVKKRDFPSKYYFLVLLSLVLYRMGAGSDGMVPAGLLAAMIVPAGLTSRKSSSRDS